MFYIYEFVYVSAYVSVSASVSVSVSVHVYAYDKYICTLIVCMCMYDVRVPHMYGQTPMHLVRLLLLLRIQR